MLNAPFLEKEFGGFSFFRVADFLVPLLDKGEISLNYESGF